MRNAHVTLSVCTDLCEGKRRFAMKKGARPLPLLTSEQFRRISRAISARTRYDILRKIFASGGLTCGGAAEGLPISAATASHHIRELFNAGLVDVTRQGASQIVAPRQRIWKAYLALLGRL
jgi:ArsR family transcriptional regulator